MRKQIVRSFTLVLCVLLVMALIAGCGGSAGKDSVESTTPDASDKEKDSATVEPVTLKLFFSGAISGVAAPNGVQDDPVAKEIERQIGVKLDFITPTAEENFLPYLASEELPDLTMVGDLKHIPQIIKGKLAIKLDELLESNGNDILENAPQKIAFSKKHYSDETGGLYVIPGTSGPPMVQDTYTFGINIRWDLYKELGYPELNTYMDVIPLIKKMYELEPTNEDGQKVYGFSFNSDWDGPTALYTLMIGPLYGWDTTEHQFHAEINNADNYSMKSMFDPDSWMFKGAEFLNKLHQEGLLDPDSLTQTWDSVSEKIKAGRVLLSFVYWPMPAYNSAQEAAGYPEKGYMPIYPKDSTNMWQFGEEPYGIGGGWVVSSKCKHPEKAMDYLNYINSIDGAMTIFSGVKDEHWILKDNKPFIQDEIIDMQKNDPDFATKTGVGKYYNASGLNAWTVHPTFDMMLDFRNWDSTRERTYSQLWKDYCEYYSVNAPYQAYDKQRTVETVSDRYRPFMGVMPDDISEINQKISEMAKTEIYKMIFAKSDEEAQVVKEDIIKKAEELGIDKELEWVSQEREKAKAMYEEFLKQ